MVLTDSFKPCILPWINFSTNTFGRPRTCGYADQTTVRNAGVTLKNTTIQAEWNNEYFRKIRQDFLNGKWPENCKRCKYVEELGGRSKRLEENRYHYDSNAHLLDHTAPTGEVDYYPTKIDIRVGTICNLKCIHCGTGASSKWNEDKSMLDKYPNTEAYNIDNKWIEQDSIIWNDIKDNLDHITHFNFLGGEPFANKQHNRFLKEMSASTRAKDITLSYVSNGTLLTEKIFKQLSEFKEVIIRLSVDAIERPGEYFRYPIKWNEFKSKLELMDKAAQMYPCLDIGVQWTCSNISMFYLAETYDYIVENFPRIQFLFCNHVEWPAHMSAQVLPSTVKQRITGRLQARNWGDNRDKVPFYIEHMNEKDLWTEHGPTFMNYLDDLDTARNISWKHNFQEMELQKYDPR